jgi:hypothetical protein
MGHRLQQLASCGFTACASSSPALTYDGRVRRNGQIRFCPSAAYLSPKFGVTQV